LLFSNIAINNYVVQYPASNLGLKTNILNFQNMKKKSSIIFPLLFGTILFLSLKNGDEPVAETRVLITTTMGDITIKLYNETPLHRDNFIKLVNEHTYDSTLFHRVINEFMVQGGDPTSKKALPGVMLGEGSLGYTVPAEINPKFYHKKGALAAARLEDRLNPKKESSSCQFYIVHGRSFTNEDVNAMEAQINGPVKQKLFTEIINRPANASLKNRFVTNQQDGKQDSINILVSIIEPMIIKEFEKTPHFTYTPEQRTSYTTVGGAPHLDGNYTIYGEVTEGLELIDKIAAQQVNSVARPLVDVKILKMTIIKPAEAVKEGK